MNNDIEEKVPTRVDYVDKREIDRSTLHSFDGPFWLIHADMGNLEFLGKSATVPRFVLLVVDLYSSKVYVYPMRSKKQILQKMKQFYEIKIERNIKKAMRFQVDNEFQEVKIKDLNEKINIEMFTSSVRGGKAFAAEQKIRELKSRIAKLSALKLKVPPSKIITTSAENTNNVLNEKYGISPNDIEKKSLSDGKFRTLFNFHQIQKTKQVNDRLDRYDRKRYSTKRRKLWENLNVCERVLVLAERIKKKSAHGKFYKQLVQNLVYFNKEQVFAIRTKQKKDKIMYYWLKNVKNNKFLTKRFQRNELFALKNNFIM